MNARRKKSVSARPKSFNSWRLVNPIGGFHKVPLAARQGFNLVLESVAQLRPQFGTANEWVVKMSSDLMVYEGKTIDKGDREVYHFVQKYDLDRCVLPTCGNEDTVCLGSIFITVKDAPNGDAPESQLLLHVPKSNEELVCVVDPSDEYVQILPHSKLKVAITQPLANYEIDWDVEIDPYDPNLKLVSLGNGTQIANDLWNPTVNACLDSNTITIVKEEKEKVCSVKYFEFALSKESAKISATMKNGFVLMTKLVFRGKDKDGTALTKVVNVVLNIPKERKTYKRFPAFSVDSSGTKKQVTEIAPENPMARREEKVDNLNTIVNPGENEALELNPSDAKICIKLPLPKSIYPGRSDDSRWKIGLEGNSSKLNLTSQADQIQWGHTFQVVTAEINPIHVPDSNSSGFIGALILSIDADEAAPPVSRRLSVWFTKPFCKNSGTQNYSCGTSGSTYNNPSFSKSHEDRIKRIGEHTRRQADYNRPAICTDLVIEKIQSKSFLDGLKTINFMSLTPPVSPPTCYPGGFHSRKKESGHQHGTYNPQPMGTKIAPFEQTPTGRIYHDLGDNHEVIIPASSMAIIRMPFREINGSLCCWAVKIVDDRLIKIVDIKSSISANSRGFMEVTVEGNLTSDIAGSANAGNIVFTSGNDVRNIKFRVVSANSRVYFPEISFKPGRIIEPRKISNYTVVRAFQNHDSVIISPSDMLYVKIPSLMENFTVSVDLMQKPLPPGISLEHQVRQLINDKCVWYPTAFPAIMNKAAVLRKIADTNPAWTHILKGIQNKKQPIHIADLVFRGVSNDDTCVDSSFGEIRQSVTISKTIHVMLLPNIDCPDSGHQICIYAPENNTEAPINEGDEVSVTLKPNKFNTEWEWPWYYVGKSNEGVEWIKLEKKSGDYCMKFKAKKKPDEGRTTVTFGINDGKGQSHRLNVHLVFKK